MAPASSKPSSKHPKKRAHFNTDNDFSTPPPPSFESNSHQNIPHPSGSAAADAPSPAHISPPRAPTDSDQNDQPKTTAQTEDCPKPDISSNDAPTANPTAGQSYFVHYAGVPSFHSGPVPVVSTAHQNQVYPASSGYFSSAIPSQQSFPYIAITPPNMASYENAGPPPTGFHFQPQVPDTTNGPFTHRYVPRHDGGFVQPCPVGPNPNPVYLPPVTLQPAILYSSPPTHYTTLVYASVYRSRLSAATSSLSFCSI